VLLLGICACLCACKPATPPGNGPTPPTDSLAQYEARIEELVTRFGNPERNLWQRPEWVLQRLGPLTGRTVADIGAGSGYFALPLAGLAHHVVAVDVDSGWVDYLQNQARANALTNLEIRLTKPDDPSLRPAEVDVVFLANTYPYIPHRVAYFSRLRPALRPGGALWVLEYLPGPSPEGPPEELKVPPTAAMAELRSAGFEVVSCDSTTLPFQYLLQLK
jgi:SAM-dependent methyltransferase